MHNYLEVTLLNYLVITPHVLRGGGEESGTGFINKTILKNLFKD